MGRTEVNMNYWIVMLASKYTLPTLWLVLLVALLVIELITVGLTTIWLAGGALVAFILAALGVSVWIQIVAFFIVSFVLIYFTRPFAIKYLNPRRTRTNSDELIGEMVKVTERIDNRAAAGRALARGMEWSARAVSDDMIIETGTLVKVLRIEGVKLIVEPAGDDPETR